MQEFIAVIFGFPTIVYSILLAVVLVYWVAAVIGLVDFGESDIDLDLAAGELVEVLQDWPAPAMPMHLVYPHRRQLSQRLQAFSQWLLPLLLQACCEDGEPPRP